MSTQCPHPDCPNAPSKSSENGPKGTLEESPGRTSAMRVMSMISLVAAIVFAGMVITGDDARQFGVYIVFGFLIAAFAPKALQKFAERDLSLS